MNEPSICRTRCTVVCTSATYAVDSLVAVHEYVCILYNGYVAKRCALTRYIRIRYTTKNDQSSTQWPCWCRTRRSVAAMGLVMVVAALILGGLFMRAVHGAVLRASEC